MHVKCVAQIVVRESSGKNYYDLKTIDPMPGVGVAFQPVAGVQIVKSGTYEVTGVLQKNEVQGKSWLTIVGDAKPVVLSYKAA